jgi:hypothetical protein
LLQNGTIAVLTFIYPMKKAFALTSLTLSALALPLVSLAATVNNLSDAGSFIINTINGILVPVLFAIAFIVFIWGAFKTFIMGANSEDVKEEGKNLMLWGLIGFDPKTRNTAARLLLFAELTTNLGRASASALPTPFIPVVPLKSGRVESPFSSR